jgi:short-subunit dehydrogenase
MANFTLITGASEGLGVEFARLAAKDGHNLILTARNTAKMETLAEELRGIGSEVVIIPADLSEPKGAEKLWAKATKGRTINVLVNNAGLGYNGAFSDPNGWEREMTSIQVNLISATYLMKQAVTHMHAGDGGRILNVASTAGFMPGPGMAVYGATKAYLLSLSEAVAEELKDGKVTVTALCPGATATNFFNDAEMHGVRLLKTGSPMKARDVAEEGWLEARIGKRIVVTGWMNKFFALMPRILPRFVMTRLGAFFLGKA